jgi:hypothetical protein
MELHALADLEGPDAAVLVGRPALGEHRAEHEVGARIRQELAGLLQHQQAAGIGHGYGIDGGGGNGRGDPEGRRRGRACSRRGKDGTEGTQHGPGGGQRHAGDAGVTQECARRPIYPAIYSSMM